MIHSLKMRKKVVSQRHMGQRFSARTHTSHTAL